MCRSALEFFFDLSGFLSLTGFDFGTVAKFDLSILFNFRFLSLGSSNFVLCRLSSNFESRGIGSDSVIFLSESLYVSSNASCPLVIF